MPDEIERFFQRGGRLAAFEIARGGNAEAWNEWRRDANLFGDFQKTRVNLALANLSGVDLKGYSLANVSFYRADLSNADMADVDCVYADFHEGKLIGANLARTNLRFARLSRAYLRDAILDYADLRGADLRRASVRGASMFHTDVRGLDLSSTRGLDQDQLDVAVGDARTKLPTHLDRPQNWEIHDHRPTEDDEGIENLRATTASVEVAVIAGMVHLAASPGDAHFASTADPVILRNEILSDLDRITPRFGNIPELVSSINAYKEELSKSEFDVILVGVRGLKIQAIFEQVVKASGSEGPEILPDASGAMRAVLIQHFLFISQSHRWKAFLEEAALAPYTVNDREIAIRSGAVVARVLTENVAASAPNVPRAISLVTSEVEIADDSQRLAVFNALASVENLFKGIITWTVREAKRFLGDAWDQFRSKLSVILGTGMATLVLALFGEPVVAELAALYPERFAWLLHAIELIKGAL